MDKEMEKEILTNQNMFEDSADLATDQAGEEEKTDAVVMTEGGVENPEAGNETSGGQEENEKEELNKLKSWLFKENVRIISATKELERMQEQFAQEKEQFQEEMKALNRKISVERQRLKDDNLFFEKKMEILKGGFAELDMDRRRLEKEWARFEAQKEVLQQPVYGSGRDVSDLFRVVRNSLALKKRYKDLIKIFHPDNVAGDKEMIQRINKEYENLKHEYDIGRWA